MLKLTVQVPQERDRTAFATLRAGRGIVASDHAAASATPSAAAQHGNPACDPLRPWGHPPLGTYRLINHEASQPEQAEEYGSHLFLFQPESGEALDAESFGRLALLVYGGASANGKSVRRTQGGLRVSDAMLAAIVKWLSVVPDMELTLVPLRQPSWWQFWKSRLEPQPLAESRFVPPAPPLDEPSVLAALLQKSVRRERRADRTDDAFDSRDRSERSSSSSDTGTQADRFQGGGGAGGGAGASGSWAAPAGGGVDSAGRIIAGAAAIGAVAAIAAGAVAAGSDTVDTTTNTAY